MRETETTNEMTRDEWIAAFVDHMRARAGVEKFADGWSVAEYARAVGPKYYDAMGREGVDACVEADMDCWER